MKGFKKCCICKAVDVIGDGMLWGGSEQGANVRNECEEYADTAKSRLTESIMLCVKSV